MNGPQLVSLVEEEIVGICFSKEVRNECQDQILPEEPMGLEHAEFLEEGKDDVLPGHIEQSKAT